MFFWNHAGRETLFGYSSDMVLGKTCSAVLHGIGALGTDVCHERCAALQCHKEAIPRTKFRSECDHSERQTHLGEHVLHFPCEPPHRQSAAGSSCARHRSPEEAGRGIPSDGCDLQGIVSTGRHDYLRASSAFVPIARTSMLLSTIIRFLHRCFQPHLDQMKHGAVNDPASYRLRSSECGRESKYPAISASTISRCPVLISLWTHLTASNALRPRR